MKHFIKISAGLIFLGLLLLSIASSQAYAIPANVTDREFHGCEIHSDYYVEALNIYAGRYTAAVVEQFFVGINVSFSAIDINDTAFDKLVSLIIAFRNGTVDHSHWPYPLWPIPPGIFVTMQFEGYTTDQSDQALEAAETVVAMVEDELGISGMYLYGYDHQGTTVKVVYYIGYESLVGVDFADLVQYYMDRVPTDGLGALVSSSNIISAPVAITAIMLQLNESSGDYLPILGDAYINPIGIETEDNVTFELSVNAITGHTGNITPSSSADFSVIRVKIPYIGNVTEYSPETDNLFPDMTGDFHYILQPEGPVNNSNSEDMKIVYNFNYNNETPFPVLRAEFSVIPVNPIYDLNYTREIGFSLEVTNVGDETAYNITTAIPVRPQDIEPHSITGPEPVNITELFLWRLVKTLNQTDIREYFEEIANQTLLALTPPIDPASRPDLVEALTTCCVYQYALQMIDSFRNESEEQGISELLTANTSVVYENMYYDPEYLEADEHGLAAVVGNWSKLESNESVKFSFKIVIPGVQNITDPVSQIVSSMQYPQKVILKYTDPGTGDTIYMEFVINSTIKQITQDGILEGLNDLAANVSKRIADSVRGNYLNIEVGPLVSYVDKVGHQMYVMGNGLSTQINSPQPVILATVEVDDYNLLIDQNATAMVTVKNVGNADASNVEVSLYHGIANYGFQMRDKTLIGTEVIGDMEPNDEVTINFTRAVRTRIGLHPIFAEITYTDDDGTPIHVYSNVLFVIVFPKFAQTPEPDYPYPTPELEISKTLDNYTPAVGQIVTVNITITNVGDEATNVVVVDTVNASSMEILVSTVKVYRDGIDITDDVKVHVFFNRKVGDYTLTKLAVLQNYTNGEVIGIYLEPNQTLTITYQVRIKGTGSVSIFPLMIIYTSLHPAFGTEGARGAGEGEGSGALKAASQSPFKYLQDDNNDGKVSITSYSESFAVALQRSTRRFPTALLIIGGAGLIFLIAAIVVYMRKKRSY
ncbi:MAG: hypothetical protein ACP6IU_05220 [Candidatus Asgardarchaeia archaeon]